RRMQTEALPGGDAVARRAAALLAAAARDAVAAHQGCALAVSGGHTPGQMLRALADEDVPWAQLHVLQGGERIAPAGDPDRNLTPPRQSLLSPAPPPPPPIHPLPLQDPPPPP